jgi:hypothetical protein
MQVQTLAKTNDVSLPLQQIGSSIEAVNLLDSANGLSSSSGMLIGSDGLLYVFG